mgnify:CR=1 FL=1
MEGEYHGKRKLLLKDGTAIILEAGSCWADGGAYEGREALMADWEKMTKENLSRVQIKNGDTVTGTYEHLILGDPVLVVRGKEDGTLLASWGIRERTELEKLADRVGAVEKTTDVLAMDALTGGEGA